MSRNTSAAVTSASQEGQLRFRLLMEIQSLSAGNFYACTGDRFLYTMGNTYSPIGHLGGLDPIQEDEDPYPREVRAWITIANSAAMSGSLNETMFRKKVTVHRTFLSNSLTTVGTPQVAFKGRINGVDLIFGDAMKGDHLSISIEPRLRQAPNYGFLVKGILQNVISSSSDIFFDYLQDISAYVPTWGVQFSAPGAPAPGKTRNRKTDPRKDE